MTPAERADAMGLLPCPFCGSRDTEYSPVYLSIECNNCQALGPAVNRNHAGRAAIKWNKRKVESNDPK